LDADLQEAARETGRLKKVEDAQRKCEEGAEALEQLRKARNKAIRDACEKGATHAQVAAITGLGRARIGQIALGAGGR
jgi:hypothetical protein